MLAIERLRKAADVANREDRVAEALDDMAATKRWENKDGSLVVVDTPFTVRARELRELYRGMRMENLAEEDRLEVLLHVKWTVKEFDCNLTREIVELIDREADLSARGTRAGDDGGTAKTTGQPLSGRGDAGVQPESARYSVAALAARGGDDGTAQAHEGARERRRASLAGMDASAARGDERRVYETVPRPRDAFPSDERLAAFVRSAHHDSTAVYVRFMKPNACTLRSTGITRTRCR